MSEPRWIRSRQSQRPSEARATVFLRFESHRAREPAEQRRGVVNESRWIRVLRVAARAGQARAGTPRSGPNHSRRAETFGLYLLRRWPAEALYGPSSPRTPLSVRNSEFGVEKAARRPLHLMGVLYSVCRLLLDPPADRSTRSPSRRDRRIRRPPSRDAAGRSAVPKPPQAREREGRRARQRGDLRERSPDCGAGTTGLPPPAVDTQALPRRLGALGCAYYRSPSESLASGLVYPIGKTRPMTRWPRRRVAV